MILLCLFCLSYPSLSQTIPCNSYIYIKYDGDVNHQFSSKIIYIKGKCNVDNRVSGSLAINYISTTKYVYNIISGLIIKNKTKNGNVTRVVEIDIYTSSFAIYENNVEKVKYFVCGKQKEKEIINQIIDVLSRKGCDKGVISDLNDFLLNFHYIPKFYR